MEIGPRLHAVRVLSGYLYLIDEPAMTLIDAGLIGSGRSVRRYASKIGRSLDDLTRIICTHAHPDHIGGVRELAGDRNVEVLEEPHPSFDSTNSCEPPPSRVTTLPATLTRTPGAAPGCADSRRRS